MSRKEKMISGRKSKQFALRAAVERCEPRLCLSTFIVNTTSDAVDPGAGLLTLRQAVAAANAHPGPDMIAFDPKVFTAGSLHTITLTQGQIEFTDTSGDTTVAGAGVAAVSGNGLSRVFQTDPGTSVSLSGLAVVSGNASVADPTNGSTYGGGIYDQGQLTVNQSVISGNTVSGSGRVQPPYGYGPGGSYGGGIFATGSLTITNSTLEGNRVSNSTMPVGGDGTTFTAGGAVYCAGSLVLGGDDIFSNTVQGPDGFGGPITSNGNAAGGGVYVGGNVSVSNSTITDNTVDGATAGYDLNGPFGDAKGGGIFAVGTATVTDSAINDNGARAGSTGGDAGGSGGGEGGGIYAGSTLILTNSTVSGNQAAASNDYNGDFSAGGGAFTAANATITQTVIDNNSVTGSNAGYFGYGTFAGGGGLYVGGSLALSQSSISGNSETCLAPRYGQQGGSVVGGGIEAHGGGTIQDSTISANSLVGGTGGSVYGRTTVGGNALGGGIYADAALTITNSTIAEDSAAGGVGVARAQDDPIASNGGNAAGGGIYSAASLGIADSTVSQNTSTGGPGGPATPGFPAGAAGSATAGGIDSVGTNTILTNSIASADQAAGAFSDIVATLTTSSQNNLVGTGGGLTNGVNGNIVGVNNPQLSPLGNYGGPTQTMLPLYTSPVVNAGSNSLIPAGVNTDQRGYPRIFGGTVDIGADELQFASVSGTVFNDLNGDGIRETGEPGLAGVTVYADLSNSGYYKAGDPTTVADSNGNYTLNGVPEGAVIIRQDLPAGYRQSDPAGGAGDHVTMTPAGATGAGFGDSARLYISGTVSFNGVGQGGVLVYADLNNSGQFASGDNNKTTTSDGSFAFVSLAAGTYTFRVVPPAGEVVFGNSAITVTLASGGVDQNLAFTLVARTSKQFTGTVIGTTGSYRNQGNTAANAFDGNLNTFFDAPTASGSWAGLDLGSPMVVTSISYAPRSGWASRMVGGMFQASNSPTFSTGVVTLYTVTGAPATGVLTTVTLSNTLALRYVRYIGPANGYCNIAEAEFFGTAPKEVAGDVIGTTGSYDNQGNVIANVFDGNLSTFFDAPTASGAWVGLDLGSPQVVTEVAYAPRSGWASRMVGGEIQASNSANFSSGVVTLFTISSTPATGVLSSQLLTNTTAYRYYRYMGPTDSYCNIAELEFDAGS